MARSTSNSFFRTSPAFSRSRCRSLFAAIPRSVTAAPTYAFEYLAPHLDGLEISLNKLNDLAALLATLDEVQEAAFDGFLRM